MIWSNLFRFVLTLALLVISGWMAISGQDVPEWLIGLTGLAVGNTFRLAPTTKEN